MPFFWLTVSGNGVEETFKDLSPGSKIKELKEKVDKCSTFDIKEPSYYFQTTLSTKLTNMDATFESYGLKALPGPVGQRLSIVHDATGGTTSLTFPKESETKKAKCIIFQEDDECVDVGCGHYISFEGLRGHILGTKKKDFCSKIECPLTDCKSVWDYEVCLWFGNYTKDELEKFQKVFKQRYLDSELSTCPKCKATNKKDKKKVKLYRIVCGNCKLHYCDSCFNKWLTSGTVLCGNEYCDTFLVQKALNECPWLPKNKNDYTKEYKENSIPSVRACPSCWSIINHKVGCLRMPCPRCKHQFCFVCLKPWNGHGYNNKTCFGTDPAPRQQLA